MIDLVTYRNYCKRLKAFCEAKRLLLVVSEDHLKKKLRGDDDFILVSVYPSHNGIGMEDNVRDVDTILLYLLQALNKADTDDEKEFQSYVELQEKIRLIKEQLITDANNGEPEFMLNLDRESIEIEPVNNIAGGYNGYSLVFTI